MKFISLTPELNEYVVAHRSNQNDPIWPEIRQKTAPLGDVAGMQIAPEQAAFLTILVAALDVQNAIEIGTFTGTSALCIARGLPENGKMLCLDKSDEWTQIAREIWEKAGVADKIELRIGDAKETVQNLDGEFDFAFIDADKSGYDAYFEAILPRLKTNGIIIFDNALRHGRVLNPESEDDHAIVALNRKLSEDSRVEVVLLPFADGMMMCRKK